MRGHQPPFLDLPDVRGCPGIKWVGSTMTDSEQYHAERWHVQSSYTIVRKGVEVSMDYWVPMLDGLEAYAETLKNRRQEGRRRALDREREDAAMWSDVDA